MPIRDITKPLNAVLRAAAVAGATLVVTIAPARADALQMLTAFPEGFVLTREIAGPFADAVAKASGGAITLSFAGPDAVPPFAQLEPVQAGVFDLLFTHPSYHAGTTTQGLALDALAPDPAARREAGIIDALDAHYQDLGLKLVAAPITGTQGFRLYLREAIGGAPALAGRRIRGTVMYHPLIEALGGAPVVLTGEQVYAALDTGVVDGTAWGSTGASDLGWYEVANYIAEPSFGQGGLIILMNLEAWRALSDDGRAAIEAAARELEAATVDRFDVLAEEELATLREAGMEMTAFSDAEAAELDRLWSEGVWQVAARSAPDAVAALRRSAEEAGLTEIAR